MNTKFYLVEYEFGTENYWLLRPVEVWMNDVVNYEKNVVIIILKNSGNHFLLFKHEFLINFCLLVFYLKP